MSINFYWLEKPPCPHCGRYNEPLHIGLSYGGWCFALRVYPDLGINDLDDWRKRWKTGRIIDEYSESITPEEMESVIRGPNRLLRHRIDGNYCIKHGDGTCDCMIGDFS